MSAMSGTRHLPFAADAWTDTTTGHGRPILTVLSWAPRVRAAPERPADGRKRAKANGVLFGRPPKLTSHQRGEAIARPDAGETLMDVARSYNVSHSTISRL